MSKGKVLILGTSATEFQVQGGSRPTGQYLNELVVPAMAFIEAGYEVILSTPSGKQPPIDKGSDSPVHFGGNREAYERAKAFFSTDPSMMEVRTIHSVVEEGLDAYAAVFTPGGHGPIEDLMQDPDVGEVLAHFHIRNKPTAFLCHGPITVIAALPNAKAFRAALMSGDKEKASVLAEAWQYRGYRMTVFSASEEKVAEDRILHAKLYFNMPDALEAAGGIVVTSDVDFAPHVIVERELITGQNPSSDRALAATLIEALEART